MKEKRTVTIVLGALLIVVVGVSLGMFFLKKTAAPLASPNESAPAETLPPDETTIPKNVSGEGDVVEKPTYDTSSLWQITTPSEDVRAANFTPFKLVYAVKTGRYVAVYERTLRSGEEKIIFEYDELKEADLSGNLWRELPPSVAFSPAKDTFVYIDQEGIKFHDLHTGQKRLLRRQPVVDELREKPLYGIFGYYDPSWHGDNKTGYITFEQSHYEGSSIGTIVLETEEYSSNQQPSLDGGTGNRFYDGINRNDGRTIAIEGSLPGTWRRLLIGSEAVAHLPEEFSEWRDGLWIDEGIVMITGRELRDKTAAKTMLFVLDIRRKELLYATTILNPHTKFLGFLDR